MSVLYPPHDLVSVQFLELGAGVQEMFLIVAVGTVWFWFGRGPWLRRPSVVALVSTGCEEECSRHLL